MIFRVFLSICSKASKPPGLEVSGLEASSCLGGNREAKSIFFAFHWGIQNDWKSQEPMFYVFCLFSTLYRRFRLSRISQTQEHEEIYRLVSKILNFMPCGSVFDRVCVLRKTIVESPAEIYLKSMTIYENLRESQKIWEHLRKFRIWTNLKESMTIYENLRKSKKIYQNLWKSLKTDENRRTSAKIYENLWKSMKI